MSCVVRMRFMPPRYHRLAGHVIFQTSILHIVSISVEAINIPVIFCIQPYSSSPHNQRSNPSSTNSLFSTQHLSTFIMDKTESIVTVDDAVKKLMLLDSKDKIWTQEMLLQVTDKAVRLLDCDTQVRPRIRPHIIRLRYYAKYFTFKGNYLSL